jgi:hypothetical protein
MPSAPKRVFHAEPAVRKSVPLLVGIMSPSGGGKTFSALRLATGMQRVYGGAIYGMDTENYRMLHYADQFKFHHVPFKPPFGSLDYLEAMKWCNQQGAGVTIIDSATHEHVGEGGYLETAEAVVTRMAGDDWKKREACKMLGWATAGPLRQKAIEGMKQLSGAFIFCFRAKEKTKPIKRADGKTDIVDMGFMPISGDEWLYEMTVNCLLEPRSDGVPTWRSDYVGERLMMKLPHQFKHIFAERAPLSEEIGEQLARWAAGGGSGHAHIAPVRTAVESREDARIQPPTSPLVEPAGASSHSPPPPEPEDESERLIRVEHELRAAADGGYEALKTRWNSLSAADQAFFRAMRDRHLIPRTREVEAALRKAAEGQLL